MASVPSGSRTVSEAPSHVPGPSFPARQVMNNQELATLIVGYFNEKQNPKDDNKKALATLATLNKTFFHATTDLFWKKVPSLSPFLRLLPLYAGDDRAKSDHVVATLQKDPWSRFLIYHKKVVHLELSDDRSIKDEMPNHWFYCLTSLPSAPRILFPKLTSLELTSLAGLNSVLPFHVSRGLQRVTIKDFTIKNKYDGLKRMEITSFLAGFASNAPSLAKMTILSPLEPAMTTAFPHFQALTDLSMSFPSPAPLDHLAFINTIPSLKKLYLISRGCSGTATIPAEGQHLNEFHKQQGKAKLEELKVHGDGSFIFWAAVFFASPSLVKFTAGIPRTFHSPAQGVFLMPHTLDILAKRAPKIRGIALAMEELSSLEGEELEIFEDEPSFRTPDGLFHSFSKLHDLTHLEIVNIPFLAQDMTLQLVANATELRKLKLLSLSLRPITNQPHHNLVFPSLETLADISVNHPCLTFLRLSVSFANVPEPVPGEIPSYPGHPLQKMFITPKYRASNNPPLSETVAVATLVDKLFPRLQDMTSAFEEQLKRYAQAPAGFTVAKNEVEQAVKFWKDVDMMVKNYQAMRRQFEAQAAAMAAAASGVKA